MARKNDENEQDNPEESAAEKRENGHETPANPEPEVMVGISMEDYDQIQQALEKAREEAFDYQDKWQRALADFANMKRRVERDQAQMRDQAVGQVVSPFLDVLDDLHLALHNRPTTEADWAGWENGITLIFRKLTNVLELQGVRIMQVEGEYFDPNFHEAISQEVNDTHDSGQIIGVVKPGYVIGDRVLRPALVRVAA